MKIGTPNSKTGMKVDQALKQAGGSASVADCLRAGSQISVLAEAIQNETLPLAMQEAVVAVAEAQDVTALTAVAEAVEEAGGAFAIAEALDSAHGAMAEAVREAGGAFAVAEALSVPSRMVLMQKLKD
ncbi:MAG: hypothetical protein GDA50_06370 [Alphaproteobacteria bacterium GM202ARS2]|nr:hypothetical protein [Alphaproteobacteria bacterium GM202ARS2]